MSPISYPSDITTTLRLLDEHAARFRHGIQLYAGSSVLSPLVAHALANSMGLMPAMGEPYQKQQPGTDEISALEILVGRQLADLFGGAWGEARLQSCTYANAAVYAAFSGPGEGVATIPAHEGGHVSQHDQGTIGVLGRRQVPLAFSAGRFDDARSADIIVRERPRIVMLGASVMLDPYCVEETLRAARAVGAITVYDASHVAGLIAGNAYQNPLALGFDLMTASTYKSLSGPVGGILAGRDPAHHHTLAQHIVGGWSSNYDATRLAGLAVALAEAQAFMPAYARSMIRHAGLLHDALRARGIEAIVSGQPGNATPSSHHVIVVVPDLQTAQRLSRQAEAGGLYVGTARVPGRPEAGGLRIGTQVITRQGADAGVLDDIAACFRSLLDNAPADVLGAHVRNIVPRLQTLRYAYPAPSGPTP